MTETGKKIKEVRLKKGLSQQDLAESAKINLRTIQRIENNETKPRGKTLKLIFDALDIEVIEQRKTSISTYQIWVLFLTMLVIISSFMSWIYRFKFFSKGERVYREFTGWNGHVDLIDGYDFYNWLLSLSAITIGLVVISNAFGLIEYKLKYILIQLFCVVLYLIAIIGESGLIRPGLFIVLVSTLLLVATYRKKRNDTGIKSV